MSHMEVEGVTTKCDGRAKGLGHKEVTEEGGGHKMSKIVWRLFGMYLRLIQRLSNAPSFMNDPLDLGSISLILNAGI